LVLLAKGDNVFPWMDAWQKYHKIGKVEVYDDRKSRGQGLSRVDKGEKKLFFKPNPSHKNIGQNTLE